jgi:hypothetical protein
MSFSNTNKKSNSILLNYIDAVTKSFNGQMVDDCVLDQIKDKLRELPRAIKLGLRFTNLVTVDFDHVPTATLLDLKHSVTKTLHERIFDQCKEYNSRRDVQPDGKRFIMHYRMLFEFYTSHTITSDLCIHFSGMKFEPEYRIEEIR